MNQVNFNDFKIEIKITGSISSGEKQEESTFGMELAGMLSDALGSAFCPCPSPVKEEAPATTDKKPDEKKEEVSVNSKKAKTPKAVVKSVITNAATEKRKPVLYRVGMAGHGKSSSKPASKASGKVKK